MKDKGPRKLHKMSFSLRFSSSDFAREASGGYDIIKVRGGSVTTRIGWPQLPVITRHFVLPAHAKDIVLQWSGEKWRRLSGRFTLAPAQPPRPAAATESYGQGPAFPEGEAPFGRPSRLPLPPAPRPYQVEYRNNHILVPLAPEAAKARLIAMPVAELASISQIGGRPVAAIRLHPLRYSPPSDKVEILAQLELQVRYAMGRARGADTAPSSAALYLDMRKLMAMVENPRDIDFEFPDLNDFDAFPPICPDDPLVTIKQRFDRYPAIVNGRTFIPPDVIIVPPLVWVDNWPYLIITDDYAWSEDGVKGARVGGLIEAFERLARWKTMKGLRARVVSISDIMANRFGTHWQPGVTRDLPEAIRNFLKFAFVHWQTRWCLLGGDSNIVPCRHVLGDIGWFYIEKKGDPEPAPDTMYLDAASAALRYQSGFDFTTSDVFFAVETGEVIRYGANATATQPGWYWTLNDYATKSATATRHIVIRAPSALLGRTFTVPQYINMIPTDFYYSSVDSPLYSLPGRHDWDNDDNGIYGWYDYGNPDGVDFGADISVGRAPVIDTQSTNDFVDKVLTYELYRDMHADRSLAADYVRRLAGIGDVWGSNWWDGSFERIRWGALDGACQDKENVIAKFRQMGVAADLIKRVYKDIYFVPRIESNLTVLDLDHIAGMRSLMNEGPHFVSVSGHGWWDGCSNFSSTNPYWVHVDGMTNWPHFGIYFVDSCSTNDFDMTHWTAYNRNGGVQAGDPNAVCLGKHLVRHGAGGAIGYLGYTRSGECGMTRELDFWEALSLPGQGHLGKMQDRAREICKDYRSWQAFIMTLMGDPELPVYTQPPMALTVSHSGTVYGSDKLTVSVFHRESPKADCTVTISQISETDPADKIYYRLVEAVAGHYTFDTSTARDDYVYITVTAKNFIPYIGRATKVSQPVSPWKYRTNGFVYDLVPRSASSIYAASGDTKLYALSPTSGLLWEQDLAGPVQDLDAAGDGSVLVGLRINAVQNLLLFDSSGNLLHSWNPPQEIWCIARDPGRNAAYAGLRDNGVRACNTASGAVRWARADLGACRHLGLDGSGNVLASVTNGGSSRIVKLASATGTTIWTYDIGGSWEFGSLALLVESGGDCYVSTRNHELHKVNAAGSQLWRKTGGNGPDNISTAVHSLAKSGATLYAGSGDGVIHAIDNNGSILWKRDIGDRVECLEVGATGTIYAGCWHGICAINAAGVPQWYREVTGGVLSLARVGNRLFGGSRDGWVYQVDISETIEQSDFVVVGDIVRLRDVIISSGATRTIDPAEIRKIIGWPGPPGGDST